MLDFTFWGAKVLHYRSVELAAVLQIPIVIALAHGEGRATVIRSEKQEGAQDLNQSKTFERTQILSINSHADAKVLRAKVENLGAAFADLEKKLNLSDLPLPQFLDAELLANGQCALLVTATKETLNAICQHLAQPSSGAAETQWQVEPATFATVTATCQGAFASNLPGTLTQSLKDSGIAVHKLIFGAMSITAVLRQQDREKAVQNLHSLIQP
jgi:aspartate kinase